MFDLVIHRRDAATDGKVGLGVKKWQIPEKEATKVKEQLELAASYRHDSVGSISEIVQEPMFLQFSDANQHIHFLAMDTIREVELTQSQ